MDVDAFNGFQHDRQYRNHNPKNQKKISTLAKQMKLDLTCIGKFTAAKKCEVILLDRGKKIKLNKLGYEH